MSAARSLLLCGTAYACLAIGAGCALRLTRIQLLDRLDPATGTYHSCRHLHVVEAEGTEYFFQYAIRTDGAPILDSLRCCGTVVPDRGTIEVVVRTPRPQDAAEAAKQAEAHRRLSERLAHARHPVPAAGQWIFLPGAGHVESCLLTPR